MALLHCPYSRIVLRSNYYYCSSQTDCISYRCTLYQFGASLAAIPSSGDLHGRFYSVSHASHEPPLKASTFLAANHFGSSAGDKAWHHRARISEDVEVVMAHGPWPVQFSERGVGRMTENATFWLLTPASVLWRTRGVLLCRAQTIMFLNASATFLGILADALKVHLNCHSWKRGSGLNACLGREHRGIRELLGPQATSTHARVG
jgi:hypothetical protein